MCPVENVLLFELLSYYRVHGIGFNVICVTQFSFFDDFDYVKDRRKISFICIKGQIIYMKAIRKAPTKTLEFS
jgi:hypothetical protein